MNLRSLALGIESFREPGICISVEEEAILVEGAAQDLADAQAGQAEVGRVEDIVDGLEDLAAVADRIETATPADVAMVDTAQRLALAGSDVESEEVTPSLEGFVGRRISTEGIKDLASKLWENLKKILSKIWAKIESFFYKLFGQIPNLRKSLKAVKDRADGMSGKSIKNSKTDLDSEINAVSIGFKGPKKASDILAGFKDMKDAATYVYNLYHKRITDEGEKLAEKLEAFDLKKGAESLKAICNAFSEKASVNTVVADLKLKAHNDSRFATDDAKKGPDLFGNKALFLVGVLKRSKLSAKTENTEALAYSEAIRGTKLDVMMSLPKERDGVSSGSIDTLTAGDVDDLVNVCGELLDVLEEYNRGKGKVQSVKARERIEKATDKLNAQGKKEEEMTASDIAYWHSAVNFNSWFTGAANQPAGSLAAMILAAVRSTIVICNKSLSNYA